MPSRAAAVAVPWSVVVISFLLGWVDAEWFDNESNHRSMMAIPSASV
jgi:hypothetical protein